MEADDVLDEVRRIREAHAARFGFSIQAIVDDMRRSEGRDGREVVPAPQPPAADRAAPPAQPESEAA